MNQFPSRSDLGRGLGCFGGLAEDEADPGGCVEGRPQR